MASGAEALRAGLRRLLAAGAALLLAGCIPSLHPLYTDKDLAFAPELLGTWSPADQKESWVFSAHEPRSYRLVHTDDQGRAGTFEVRLLRLEGRTFLDLYPENPPGSLSDYDKVHLVKAHAQGIEPQLRLQALNPRWLDELLKKNGGAIAHERRGPEIVLTAPTRELQAFVLMHLGTKDAYGKPVELTRKGGT